MDSGYFMPILIADSIEDQWEKDRELIFLYMKSMTISLNYNDLKQQHPKQCLRWKILNIKNLF